MINAKKLLDIVILILKNDIIRYIVNKSDENKSRVLFNENFFLIDSQETLQLGC